MRDNKFKKDMDLLSEAYSSINKHDPELEDLTRDAMSYDQADAQPEAEDYEDNEIGTVDVTDVMNKIEQMDAGQLEELLQGLAYHFDASGDVPDEVRHAFEQVSDHLHEVLAAWQNRISN